MGPRRAPKQRRRARTELMGTNAVRNFLIAATAALLAAASSVQAAEIKALITTAMDGAIVVLVPQFEKATGHKVTVSYDASGALARRLRGGEFADMILVASP